MKKQPSWNSYEFGEWSIDPWSFAYPGIFISSKIQFSWNSVGIKKFIEPSLKYFPLVRSTIPFLSAGSNRGRILTNVEEPDPLSLSPFPPPLLLTLSSNSFSRALNVASRRKRGCRRRRRRRGGVSPPPPPANSMNRGIYRGTLEDYFHPPEIRLLLPFLLSFSLFLQPPSLPPPRSQLYSKSSHG